jgi:ATP-binding cassette, subfamily C, type I secretion system permease/ATPase
MLAPAPVEQARPGGSPKPSRSPPPPRSEKSELKAALSACRGALIGIGGLTAVINVLTLTGSLFMLEVYDRVLPSRSVPTLVGLAILAGVLLAIQGILDLIRSRVLVRIGAYLDTSLSRRVYTSLVRLPLRIASRGDGLQPLRDLDSLRSFLSGLGPTALFDLPWIPVYLVIIYAFHPLLGIVALCGALILVAITLTTEALTRTRTKSASTDNVERHGLAETGRRNAEVLVAMGMTERMADRWEMTNAAYLQAQNKMADVAGGFGAISKILRVMLQSAVLGVGAYLVIHQEATAGIIIAGSILTARAFAPVDLAIAHWKGFVGARQSRQRLATLLETLPAGSVRQPLPTPSQSLRVEALSAAPPGGDRLVVADVNFELKAGQGLGVIGPSAAGKSSLARLLVGVWQPLRGKVRMDGAALDQWEEEVLGRYIGYLPQDVELFAGTVADNISRFDSAADPAAVVAAAKAAGAHDLIVGLRNGYDTVLGGHGLGLSTGQQQRIALARALYGDPFLVVLDEPNSNLDADGEAALTQAILSVRERGGIVIVVSHRPSALAGVDTVLIMNQGRAMVFGPKDEVLPKVTRPSTQPAPAPQPPIRAVPETASLAS